MNLTNSTLTQNIITSTINPEQNCWLTMIVSLILIVGLFKIIRLIVRAFSPLSWLPYDLYKRYSSSQQPTWALITGGSQGIGLGFAQQLAKRNFNIVILSRSQPKLKQAKQSILKINPNIKVQYQSVDFQKLRTAQQYQQIVHKFDHLDISVLVNNLGYMNPYKYLQNTYEQIKRQAVLNLLPITCLTRLFLPKMLQRNSKTQKRSAIINLASGAALSILSHSAQYCATKAFDDMFTRSIQEEYRKQSIDFLSVRPYLVTSSMTRNINSLLHVSPNQCANGALNDLGKYNVTHGHFFHRIQGVLVDQLNGKIVNFIMCLFSKDLSAKYKAIDMKNK